MRFKKSGKTFKVGRIGGSVVSPSTPEKVWDYYFTVGSTSTQLGYWSGKGIGSSTDPVNFSRFSITLSNSNLFIELNGYTENQLYIDVEGFGEISVTYSSGRYVKSGQTELMNYLTSKHLQQVGINIRVPI